ncbi:hypothetical protein [Embleya sp. NPDC001921]
MGGNDVDAAVTCPVLLETRHWLTIDGTLDNEVKSRADRGDSGGVEFGRGIRRAGWEQIPDWPRTAAGFATWPAAGRTSMVALSATQWALVVSGLEFWADVDDSLDIPEHTAMAQEKRTIAGLVRARLAEQGWSSP